MEFTFLGTSSGTPTLQRNVTGLALKHLSNKAWYLVDCGEATQHQLLRTPYSLPKLAAIFITHVHGDHCYGLPGLLGSAAMHGRKAPLPIIAPSGVHEFIRSALQHTDMYLPYSIRFFDVENHDEWPLWCDFNIRPVTLSHRVPSFGFVFEEKRPQFRLNTEKLIRDNIPKGPLWGEIQKGHSVQLESGVMVEPENYLEPIYGARKIIVGGDNDTPARLQQAAEGADVLIHEATYTSAIAKKVGEGPQHSCAERVARFAQEVAIKNLVLTHFSARYHSGSSNSESSNIKHSVEEIRHEAARDYDGRLYLANDLEHYVLSSDGVLEFFGGVNQKKKTP